MLAVRQRPELVTPGLLAWVRGFVRYDSDGRCSSWLVTAGGGLPRMFADVAEAVMPGVVCDGVLLQGYRDGNAVTPCHTDAGQTGFGFILSLGEPRTFRVHPIAKGCDDATDEVRVECVGGTVLIMDESFHAGWHHQIAADPDAVGEKLSLVFRTKVGG